MTQRSFGGVDIDDFVVVCASELERAAPDGVLVHALGIGKAAAAMRLPAVLRAVPTAKAVLLIGVAGAYPDRHRQRPAPVRRTGLCIVGSDRFGDEGVETPTGFLPIEDVMASHHGGVAKALWSGSPVFPANPRMAHDAAERLAAPVVHGVTVSTCSGTEASSRRLHERSHADVETMEGAAVAFVCRQLELPLLHLRAISNWTGDRDRADWALGEALDALRRGMARLFAPV